MMTFSNGQVQFHLLDLQIYHCHYHQSLDIIGGRQQLAVIILIAILFSQQMTMNSTANAMDSSQPQSPIDQDIEHLDIQEPSYNHLVYGGIWKHAILSPPESDDDVVKAKEAALTFIKNRIPALVRSKLDEQTSLITKLNLWYTLSGQEPVLLEDVVGKSHKNLVSVPFTFGNTYNFRVETKDENHQMHLITITVTNMPYEEKHYIYSHTYQPINEQNSEDSPELSGGFDEMVPSINYPLSMLAMNKDLKSGIGNLKKDSSHNKCSLSVMTYNIWNFFTYSRQASTYTDRIARLVERVHSLQPDIVGFQEIRLESQKGAHLGPSQMDHIIPHLPGYQFVFQPAMMQGNCLQVGRNEEGVGIFSKFPIIHHEYILLYRNTSNSADGHQRICLHAIVDVPDAGLVHVFNTHWSLDHIAREKAANQILDFMQQYEGPAILMGDLNAKPEEEAINILTQQLTDMWSFLHPQESGATYNALNEAPTDRIDYIMFRQNEEIQVNSVEVIGDKPGKMAASDHCPVLAKFTLNP